MYNIEFLKVHFFVHYDGKKRPPPRPGGGEKIASAESLKRKRQMNYSYPHTACTNLRYA